MRRAFALVAVLAAQLALAAPGDFIPGNSTLPGPWVTQQACPFANPNACWTAGNANTLRDSLNDLRTNLLNGANTCVTPSGGSSCVFLQNYLANPTGNATSATALPPNAATAVNLGILAGGAMYPRTYGAKGDGSFDDTSAVQAAINTGKTVRCTAGDSYVVNGGLTQTTTGQVLDFTGCTVKLADHAATKWIVRLSGQGARVIGGTWDLNGTNNPETVDSYYDHEAVRLNADRTTVERAYIINSRGLGIRALAGVNHAEARGNRVVGAQVIGIFFDGPGSGDAYGNRIADNFVDTSVSTSSIGVYIASTSPYTYVQRRWAITGNEVVGPQANATGASVGVVGRGTDGLVSANTVSGFNLGISLDYPLDARNVVSGNTVRDMNGSGTYGIEVNGGKTTIVGNTVLGGVNGIAGSVTNAIAGSNLDGIVVSGNVIRDQTTMGIYFFPGSGTTGQRLSITGNTILNSTASAVKGIYLNSDCRYSTIAANTITGPGSGNVNSRGVFLDSVNSDVAIIGNRFAGWERPVSVYNAGAVAQARIFFGGNDVSSDIGGSQDATWLSLEGSATWGSAVQLLGNFSGNSSTWRQDVYDRASLTRWWIGNSMNNPENQLTAAPGSLWMTVNGGGGTALYVKQSGTGNTGWIGK